MKVPCAFCGEPVERHTGGTDREGNEVWYHHGEDDDPWDDGPIEPSCYEKASWRTEEEDSLLDFIMQPKKEDV